MEVARFEHCVCRKMDNCHQLCAGAFMLAERGKKVKFSVRAGEQVKAIVIDGCVCNDNDKKCDGLFLFLSHQRSAAFLVELKGGDLSHAFEQLRFTKEQRPEYIELVSTLASNSGRKVIEKSFIISNKLVSAVAREQLENRYQIRVHRILHCEATTKIPDLRDYLNFTDNR
ncbi:hypothetical protein CKO12_01800 [Chromatium okenii]|nr:hypothetical protein [Chromatium okenii]